MIYAIYVLKQNDRERKYKHIFSRCELIKYKYNKLDWSDDKLKVKCTKNFY